MRLLKSIKNKAYAVIRLLQDRFKIDLFYLIKNESWLMSGRVISLTASFILSLAWANWISKEIYGNYQYVLSLVGIISIFSLPEMGTAVTQAVARGFEGSFISGFKAQLKWGVLETLSALGIAGYYYLQGNKSFSLTFLVIAAFLPLFDASAMYISFLRGKKLFSTETKYNSIVTQVLATAAMISVLFCIKKFLSDAPIHIALLLIMVVYFSFRTGLRLFFFVRAKTKFQANKKEDPKIIGFGKHLTLSRLIDVAVSNLDKILLFHYLGPINLAIYSFATLVPQQITEFIDHIDILSMPKFSVRSREEIRNTVLQKIYYLLVLITVFVLIYIAAAPLVYKIFFPKYLASVPYSRLYALSIIPMCFSVIGSVLKAKMMIRQIYQLKILSPLFRVSLLLFLIPLYGMWGAIIAILCARIFSAILFTLFFKKI